MSGFGESTFTPSGRKRKTKKDTRIQVHIKCTNCGGKVLYVVPVKSLYAFREGDPRIKAYNADREVETENWCLSCIRAASIENDREAIKVSVAQQ